jgi:hypothetical protein
VEGLGGDSQPAPNPLPFESLLLCEADHCINVS